MGGYGSLLGAQKQVLSELLEDALREVARIERALSEAGDRRMLARYGNPDHGVAIAVLLGYSLLSTDEARTVDQLTYFPQSSLLIREYLASCGAPRTWDVDAKPLQSQGGGLYTQRPATIVATTCASRSCHGSRSRTTRSAV